MRRRDAIRPEFVALEYFINRFDSVTSQKASSPSSQQQIEAVAEELLDIIAGEVQRLAREKRQLETRH